MYYESSTEINKIIESLHIEGMAAGDVVDHIDHGELVSRLADMLALRLNLDDRTRELIHNASVLHDVGKLKISQNIYGRVKGGLRIVEMRYMRTHPKLGAEMLMECGYPEELVSAVLHHHESFDGSGYPSAISGEEIPYASRLIKVCDAFATLISDRPYRRAFEAQTALNSMIADNMMYDIKIFVAFMDLTHTSEFENILSFADDINKKHHYM